MARLVAIVPTLGSEPRLAACLEALQGCERVVVTQGTSPAPTTCERVVRFEKPVGFARAVNAGLAASDSELVAVVNDDCVVGAGWAERLTAVLADDPTWGSVQGVVLAEDGRTDGLGIGWNRWWEPIQVGCGGTPPAADAKVDEVFGVSATAAVYRRSAIKEVGAFDEQLGTWYEDVDLAVRLRAGGWRAGVVLDVRAIHAGGATTAALALPRSQRIRNRWLVLARLMGRHFPAIVPQALWADLRQLPYGWLAVPSGWVRAGWWLATFGRAGAPLIAQAELTRWQV